MSEIKPKIKSKMLILIDMAPLIMRFDFKSLNLFASSRLMKAISSGK